MSQGHALEDPGYSSQPSPLSPAYHQYDNAIPRRQFASSRGSDRSDGWALASSPDDTIKDYSFVRASDTWDSINNTLEPLSLENGLEESHSKKNSRRCSPFEHWWFYEILASTFSVAAAVALVVLLRYFDKRSALERWPYDITPNGVVAVFSTIIRTSLMIPVASAISQNKWVWLSSVRTGLKMSGRRRLDDIETFDNASRGSLGSAQLIWRLKGRHIASFGALITILSLGFDGFTQQVLAIQSLTISETSSSVEVPRSESFSIFTHEDNMSLFTPEWDTIDAMMNGILSKNISDLPVSCPTGNCTWSVVPSLSVCGSCTSQTWNKTCSTSTSYPACNYTLPDGNSLYTDGSDGTTMFQVFQTEGRAYNASSSTTSYVANFNAIGMPWQTQFWNESLLSAKECALWMCIQSYEINVTSNVQSQRTLLAWNMTEQPDEDTSFGLGNHTFTGMPAEMNVVPNTRYYVNSLSIVAWENKLSDILNGSAGGGAEGLKYDGNYIEGIWAWHQEGTRDDDGSTLDGMVDNLARSLGNNVRQTSPANATQRYYGTASRDELFILVRWSWLTLPLTLVLFSVLFLVASILQTKHSRVKPWKSSPLAMLFSTVDKKLKEDSEGSMNEPDALIKAVGRTEVVLRNDGESWGFHSTTS